MGGVRTQGELRALVQAWSQCRIAANSAPLASWLAIFQTGAQVLHWAEGTVHMLTPALWQHQVPHPPSQAGMLHVAG